MSRAGWDGDGNDAGTGRRESTCPVDAHPSGNSKWGLSDLAGNVWEWTSSIDADTGEKIVRGGAWSYSRPEGLRTGARAPFEASYRSDYIGFRCAR